MGHITRVVCASPDYLRRHGVPAVPDELRAHACITFEGLMSAAAWSFRGQEQGTQQQRVPIRSRLVVNTADAAIAAAMRGVGITRLLSYQVVEAMTQGALVRLLAPYEPAAIPVHLLYARQGRLPAKTRAFVALAVDRLGGVLGGAGQARSPAR